MKKIFLALLIYLFLFSQNCFAYSERFELMIDTMGITHENENHKRINEDVFNSYSLFVYGSPLDGYNGQRFKEVEEGKWTQNAGPWQGVGTRGEYWILGENKYAYEVHNHKFPVDIEPPTPPTKWRYAVIKDAINSWQDQSKYMDEEQKDYMLNSKLMRNGVEYDITANDIGLDKIRLENYATWKSYGTLYTQRYDVNNQKWAANFMVKPLAGNAELESFAVFPNGQEYSLSKEDEDLIIPIEFGARAINLTNFAKKEHVKEIKSELYINGELISNCVTSQELEISSNAEYIVDSEFGDETIILNIKVKSTLLTKFTTDGALVDIKEYVIVINGTTEEPSGELLEEYEEEPIKIDYVKEEYYANFKEIPPPYVESVDVKIIKNKKENELLKTKYTGYSFVCAGQTIQITAVVVNGPADVTLQFQGDKSIHTFDDVTKKFEWDEPRSRGVSTFFGTLKEFENMYKDRVYLKEDRVDEEKFIYTITYIIPYGTKQTLNSWASLRNNTKDAFNIDERKLFTRISSPYQIVIKAKNPLGADTYRTNLDVFERWDTIYNRDLSQYIERGPIL